jgi:hypothetical protein
MTVKIKDTLTADGERFERMMKDLKKMEVRIGIQQKMVSRKRGKKGGKKSSQKDVDLVDIAMWNELGTVRSPSRPFLRDSVDKHTSEIYAMLQRTAKRLAKGESAEDALKRIGVYQKGLIRKEIVNGDFAPNAPSTIREKGSDRPLIDTGRMRQSVNYVIQEKGESD